MSSSVISAALEKAKHYDKDERAMAFYGELAAPRGRSLPTGHLTRRAPWLLPAPRTVRSPP